MVHVKIQPLADKAIAAVKPGADGKKAIRITPEQYEKTYLNWMENIHDWCISRQLWWGHRIPAWHCAACHKITVRACRSDGLRALRLGEDHAGDRRSGHVVFVGPVAGFRLRLAAIITGGESRGLRRVLSDKPAGHRLRHSVLLGGAHDHAGLLVCGGCSDARWQPALSCGSVPFREVYIHALVRDANREKMSKTKGNVVDPIEIVKQYGTDAVRFTLAVMASPGTDIAFNVARTEGYRAFANKIWNAARFIFMNVDRAAEIGITVDPSALGGMPEVAADAPLEARWIVAELHATAAKVNQSLENYRYDDAANTIYQFFWGSFCDWYLEIVKLRLDFSETADKAATKAALTTLVSVFEAALRLLSPFMPFLTEEIWHAVYDGNPPAKSIALTRYPQAAETAAWMQPL